MSPLRPGARNPTSFWVEDDHWYDFGSAEGGDVIDLAAALQHNGDLSSAVRELARELGIKNEHTNETWRADIQNLCNRTAAYHAALTPGDYEYLSARGLTPEDVSRLMIGRVTDGYLKGRLFLPYFKNGAVVYYATRAMPGGSFAENKYMKASKDESPSYQHIPWGLQTLTRRSIHDTLIISEGYFDAVSWEREGYPVLSPITGSFSAAQWPDVIAACRMFSRVLIIFDNDAVSHAGEGFTLRTARKLLANKIPFVVGHTPSDIKDVNDYYTQGGSLQKLIDTAEDGLSFLAMQCDTVDALEAFVLSVKRHATVAAISAALNSVKHRFSGDVIKALKKLADSVPSEPEIANEIRKAHSLLYVNNVGFYEWNGQIWRRCEDGDVKFYANNAYGRFANYQRISAVCNLLKVLTARSVTFDRNQVLTFQNGTLEIETGNFRAFSEADYCSIQMQYDYDPEARCPEWTQFINDVTNDEPMKEEILQFIAGYVLFPTCKHQKVFILVGNGGNGKSVYLEVIQKLFGDENVTHVEPTGLIHDFQRIRLKDSLLNIGSDINSDFSRGEIREWLLKVADGTSIQACYKGKDHVDFIPRCKLVYACNALPTAEIINGLNRRLQFVDFPCRYVENPDPNDPLQKPKDINLFKRLLAELPGIFNWAYDGYRLLSAVGYFTDAPEQEALLREFEETSNPVMVFCGEHSWSGTVPREDIYNEYKFWCVETGHKALSRERFMPKFRDCMGGKILEERQVRKDGKRTRAVVFL